MSGRIGCRESVPAKPRVQLHPRDAEAPRRLHLVAAGLAHEALDRASLDRFEIRAVDVRSVSGGASSAGLPWTGMGRLEFDGRAQLGLVCGGGQVVLVDKHRPHVIAACTGSVGGLVFALIVDEDCHSAHSRDDDDAELQNSTGGDPSTH